MAKQVIILPAWTATPDFYWYTEVKDTLTNVGYTVKIAAVAETNRPELDPWQAALKLAINGQTTDTVLIGHGMGGVNVLRYLEQDTLTNEPFTGILLVSTPAFQSGSKNMAEFFSQDFDFVHSKKKARSFVALYDINDQVLIGDPIAHGRVFVQSLAAKMIVLPGGGHFTPSISKMNMSEVVNSVIEMFEGPRLHP